MRDRNEMAHTRAAMADFVRRGLADKMSVADIGREFDVSPGTVNRWIEADVPEKSRRWHFVERDAPNSKLPLVELPDPTEIDLDVVEDWTNVPERLRLGRAR